MPSGYRRVPLLAVNTPAWFEVRKKPPFTIGPDTVTVNITVLPTAIDCAGTVSVTVGDGRPAPWHPKQLVVAMPVIFATAKEGESSSEASTTRTIRSDAT